MHRRGRDPWLIMSLKGDKRFAMIVTNRRNFAKNWVQICSNYHGSPASDSFILMVRSHGFTGGHRTSWKNGQVQGSRVVKSAPSTSSLHDLYELLYHFWLFLLFDQRRKNSHLCRVLSSSTSSCIWRLFSTRLQVYSCVAANRARFEIMLQDPCPSSLVSLVHAWLVKVLARFQQALSDS